MAKRDDLEHPAHFVLIAEPAAGGGDHTGLDVGEQHRGAVGGDYPEDEAGSAGNDRIGVGAPVVGQRCGDDDRGGRVDLIRCRERGAWQDRIGSAAAVGGGKRWILAAPEPAIARSAAEEAVRDGSERGGAD